MLCKALWCQKKTLKLENMLLVYEAGPCGLRLAALLAQTALEVRSHRALAFDAKPAEPRIKTDRRGALLLARELGAGSLTNIVVPDAGDLSNLGPGPRA